MMVALKIDPSIEYVYRHNETAPDALAELSVIELLVDTRNIEGDVVPAGTVGVVVGRWNDGSLDIEVGLPSPSVVTAQADQIRPK